MTLSRFNQKQTELARESLTELRGLLTWSDEIPDEIIDSPNTSHIKYKCRKNFFAIVSAYCGLLIDSHILNDASIEGFCHFASREISTRERITPDDIGKANSIILYTIEKLEALLGDQIADGDSDESLSSV